MALPTPMKRAGSGSKGSGVTGASGVVRVKRKQGKAPKVARGRMAKALVFNGKREKTAGGLRQDALMKNKRGKIVSKRASANAKLRYRQSKIEDWIEAVMEAREALHTKGFVAINGQTLHGKALYVKAKAIRASHKKDAPS